jgi:hypothetical protein
MRAQTLRTKPHDQLRQSHLLVEEEVTQGKPITHLRLKALQRNNSKVQVLPHRMPPTWGRLRHNQHKALLIPQQGQGKILVEAGVMTQGKETIQLKDKALVPAIARQKILLQRSVVGMDFFAVVSQV